MNNTIKPAQSSLATMTKVKKVALAVAISFAVPVSANATDNDQIKQLQQQIDALTHEVAKIKQNPSVKTKGGGVKVKTSDGKKSFQMGGRFQLDYNRFDGVYNANHNGKTGSDLFPRRIRTYVAGQADNWDYKLLLDFSDNSGEIVLARLRYKGFANGPTIKLGKIREDISLEALTSSKHITTISRSMLANSMSPYFKYGVSAYQYFKDTGLRYAVGVYKGGSFGTDGKDEDSDLNLSVTGRLTWSPIHSDSNTLHFGLWGSQRDMAGDNLSEKFARGEVRKTNVRLVNYAAGGAVFAVDDINQYGVEFASVNGPLSIQAEYAVRDVNAVDSINDSTYEGYYVTASYFLTGEHRVYKKSGVFSSPTPLSKSGAWEVYARFSQFDATANNQGTEAKVTTLGTTYYLNKKIKLMVNYLISDVSGPGTAALVGKYTDGNALTARLQYLF